MLKWVKITAEVKGGLYQMKSNIVNIRAYINPNEGHCFHSEMFRAKFRNEKLHPAIKALKVEVFPYTAGDPSIYLYDNEDDQKPIFSQVGAAMDMNKVEGILLHRLGVE